MLGVAQRIPHHAERAVAIVGRRGHVERVGAHPVPRHLGQDVRAAPLRELQLFEHQNPGALADHKSVALAIPRARRALRLVVARRERAHGGKSADAHGRDAGFGAAADHGIGVAALDEAERIADGMRAGGAGRRGRGIRTLSRGCGWKRIRRRD